MDSVHGRAAAGLERSKEDILSACDVVLNVEATDVLALIVVALDHVEASRQVQAGLRAHCGDLVDRTSMLDERVALTHAHVDGLDRPRLLVVTTREPLPVKGGALCILFILLNLPAIGPERHLANLATVARAIRVRSLIDALLAAKDAEQARRLLPSPEQHATQTS